MLVFCLIVYIAGISILFYEQSLHGDIDVVDILLWPVIVMMMGSIILAALLWQMFRKIKRRCK